MRGSIGLHIRTVLNFRNNSCIYAYLKTTLMNIRTAFLSFCLFLCCSLGYAQALQPVGTWTNEEGEARFEIYRCQNDQLCGKIIWLKEPLRDGKPKTDIQNPDAKLRSRPVMGMVMMEGFKHDSGNEWESGTIYDPKSGKTYSCNLKMQGKNKLEVRGYIGFSMIGRSQTWTRVE